MIRALPFIILNALYPYNNKFMPVAVIPELSVEKVQLPSYFLPTEYGEENVKVTAVVVLEAVAACDKVKVVPLIAETVVPEAMPVPVTV